LGRPKIGKGQNQDKKDEKINQKAVTAGGEGGRRSPQSEKILKSRRSSRKLLVGNKGTGYKGVTKGKKGPVGRRQALCRIGEGERGQIKRRTCKPGIRAGKTVPRPARPNRVKVHGGRGEEANYVKRGCGKALIVSQQN